MRADFNFIFLFYLLLVLIFFPCQTYSGEEELSCVYVPTNHLYIGDIFLVNAKDVIRPNLSVREGIGKICLQLFWYDNEIVAFFVFTDCCFENSQPDMHPAWSM